jgi:hypothetical protein
MQMAPLVVRHPEARPQEASPVTNRSVLAGDGIAYAGSKLEGVEQDHPHACTDGLVFLAYTVFDEEVGDEVERVEALPCRRCAEEK